MTHPSTTARAQVLSYSGLGLREEALAGPGPAIAARAEVDALLARVPEATLVKARALRAAMK